MTFQFHENESGQSRLASLGLCLILILTFALRLPGLLVPIWSIDEGTQAVMANTIINGGTPYVDMLDNRAPLPWYIWALTFLFFGSDNMNAIRMVQIGLASLIIVLIFLIGRFTIGVRGALFGSFFFSVISSVGLDRIGYMFQPEWCLAVFTCLASYLFLRGLQSDHGRTLMFLSGLSYGLAFFCKQNTLFDTITPFFFLIYLGFSKKKLPGADSLQSCVSCALLIFLGFIVVVYWFSGYFYVKGAWKDFVFYFWAYNIDFWIPVRNSLERILFVPFWFFRVSTPMNLGVWAIMGFIIICLGNKVWGESRRDGTGIIQAYIAFWSVTSFLATTIAFRPYKWYVIQLLPAWCLLAGVTFERVLNSVTIRPSVEHETVNKKPNTLVRTFIILLVAIPALSLTVEMAKTIQDWKRNQQTDLVEWIKNHSRKDQKIYVWGFAPYIYTQTNRTPASRYPYNNFQTGILHGVEKPRRVPGSMETLLKELDINRPCIIVETVNEAFPGIGSSMKEYPDLWSFINKHYSCKKQFKQGSVWQLRSTFPDRNNL